MRIPMSFPRRAARSGAWLLLPLLAACLDGAPDATLGPTAPTLAAAAAQQGLQRALEAQNRHTPALLRMRGVVGTAVGMRPDGTPTVRVFVDAPGVRGLPAQLDGVPVSVTVSGRLVALSDPTTRQRPAPLGFSVGHPAITAGTIGARVIDVQGRVYVLSNNHVLANSNNAAIGDATLQPGAFDGGTSADQIGTLANFNPINFAAGATNVMDAAIALTTTANVGNSTPTDDGYGAPGGQLFNDANDDGAFDNVTALLGLPVQKYGRTTKLTHGTITGINATLSICYEVVFIFCLRSATFTDQLIIEPGGFSGGGDSGSLIVTDDAGRNPVGLLFAGSSAQTIANRIDLVLAHFNVRIDDGDTPPPPPVTDVAMAGVSAPASVTQGSTVNVTVTIRNVGNQDVSPSLDVTLRDETAGTVIGTQAVSGLAAGAQVTRTFAWNTGGAAPGVHTLTASHNLPDDNAANDQASATTEVTTAAAGLHIGDLDGMTIGGGGSTWSATVEVTVHDANHNVINGATVVGAWTPTGLNSNTCTTGELGGTGTCIMLYPSIKRNRRFVTFTVSSVTKAGLTYVSSANHDPDGSSDGTTIRVNRP